MEQSGSVLKVSVLWRGNKYVVEMNPHASLKELGDELWKLTNVKEDTMRFIVPQNKSSKLLSPFSNDHASLSLQDMPIIEGKPIRMMGVSEDEVERILQNEKVDLRIVGFEEEEKRLRQRMLDGPRAPLKLPQGPYIFCNFHTLEIPGVELNPPASEALKIMHMLAADPGIVAIMNKHRWRVGKMTELAPVGYVGISPKCILGFNKNQGEEISLRLRTDDLKGFRKYESIKKTLLHELAHMVYSEHDANFYALDKQLNQEAATLDWTKSTGHTLSGAKKSDHYENFYVEDSRNFSQKLGGNPDKLASAHASSVAAAYRRLANSSTNGMVGSKVHEEPDPGDSGFVMHGASHNMDLVSKENLDAESSSKDQWKSHEPDPDDHSGYKNKFEPDPDDSQGMEALESGNFSDFEMVQQVSPLKIAKKLLVATSSYKEPDPDDSKASCKSDAVAELHSLCSLAMEVDCTVQPRKATAEPDPDDLEAEHKTVKDQSILYKAQVKHDPDEMLADRVVLEEPVPEDNLVQAQGISGRKIDEPDPDDQELRGIQDSVTVPEDNLVQPQEISGMKIDEPDPDDQELRRIQVSLTVPEDNLVQPQEMSSMKIDEPDPDEQELRRIQYSVNVVCSRLQKSIEMLRAEVNPMEATGVLHTLFKIIRNVIEHPDEVKYKRLRKGNPIIQRNVANYKAAIEILYLVGFNEDVVLDEIGKAETYLVLKRNDPGLLWLAKSSLETCIAY